MSPAESRLSAVAPGSSAARARSLVTLRRFGRTLAALVAAALVGAAAGGDAVQLVIALCLGCGMVCGVLAHAARETVDAPYFTRFDEGVWFFIAGHLARLVLAP